MSRLLGLVPALLLLCLCAGSQSDASEPPAEALLAELPFLESDMGANRIFVDLAPPGKRALRMLLDTGATGSVLTPRYARSLGVSARRGKSSPYRRSTVLGRDLQFWIADGSSDTSSRTGWEYGLLGGEFLAAYVLELDFVERMVRFYDPKRFEVPKRVEAAGEAVTKIQLVSNRPFIVRSAQPGSKKKLRLLLDTGAPGALLLSGSAAKKMGVDVDALPSLTDIGGTVGETEARLLENPDFELGPFALGAISALVAPRGFYNQGGSDDSLLGFDILSQFKLRIDYKRRRVWLKRVRDTPVTFGGLDPSMMRKTGAYLFDVGDGRYQVIGVLAGSPAERFGLRPNDYLNVPAVGEEAPGPEGFERAVLESEPLPVTRMVDDVLVDLVLPAPEEAPEAD